MTEETAMPVPGPESPQEAPLGAPEGDGAEEPQKSNKEARYRVERNEARAGLEKAQQQIEKLQRVAIEKLADVVLAEPSDLFTLSGKTVADFLTEDGLVDVESVRVELAQILEARPGMKKTAAHDPSQGLGGKPKEKPGPSWASLLQAN